MSSNQLQPLPDVSMDSPTDTHGLNSLLLAGSKQRSEVAVESWRYEYAKRAFDFLGALILTILFFVPGLVIAILVACTSPGPVFYREERIGRYQVPFRIWKFRSMCNNAAQNAYINKSNRGTGSSEWRMKKHLSDPRITRVGAILRSWSLDEIPQLLNVLSGDMSLVGPRPIVKSEEPLYGDYLHYYHAVVPGMSGLWQVSGRSSIGYDERAKFDMRYVQTWSLLSDIKILLMTLPAVLGKVGAI